MANTDKELGYLAPLKKAVGKAESKGIYHNYNQGVPTGENEKEEDARHGDEQKLITEMTLRELMDYQKKPPGDRNRIFAAGKYQIVPNTLKELLSYKFSLYHICLQQGGLLLPLNTMFRYQE